jgi:hypothetical protein
MLFLIESLFGFYKSKSGRDKFCKLFPWGFKSFWDLSYKIFEDLDIDLSELAITAAALTSYLGD